MYRLVESETPTERPGAEQAPSAKEVALARIAETKKNVAEQRRQTQEETARRKAARSKVTEEEPEMTMTELSPDEAEALEQEVADSEAVVPRFERRAPRTAEQEEMAHAMSGELDRERTAAAKRDALMAERAEIKTRMEAMGGVWGGDEFFTLNERFEEIERELHRMDGGERVSKKKREQPIAREEVMVPGEPTPEDRVADARKNIDYMNGYEQEIAARQKALQAELKKHGIRDTVQIHAELETISPELRESSIGIKPDLRYRMSRLFRNLMGRERSAEVKELLQKFAELENEMNEQLHKRREAEAELVAAHAAAGHDLRPRKVTMAQARRSLRVLGADRETVSGSGRGGSGIDLSPVLEALPATPDQLHVEQELESLKHIEEGSVQKELAAIRALKTIEEEIQNSMIDFSGRKEAVGMEDVDLYQSRMEDLHLRLRNLEISSGKSPAALEALQNAEAAYAQYRRMINQALSSLTQQAREAGKGERIESVMTIRGGREGNYGTSKADRRVVQLHRMGTEDKKEQAAAQERREAEALRERVNKEVQVYRSEKWRKDLIDTINQNEAARAQMHALYDAFKARASELHAEGAELGPLQTSPDPALDYALNLYRLHAKKKNGQLFYDDEIRESAAEALSAAEVALGKGWDAAAYEQRLKEALSEKTGVEKASSVAEAEAEAETPVENAQVIPGVPSELYVGLAEDLKTEPQAIAFAYRLLNREEVKSLTKPFAVRQIMRRMKVRDEGKAERLYEAMLSSQEAEPIPLTRVKREKVEPVIEFGPIFSREEVEARAKMADAAAFAELKKAVGLTGKRIKPKNIAAQYEILVKMAGERNATAAARINKVAEILKPYQLADLSEDLVEEQEAPEAPDDVPSLEELVAMNKKEVPVVASNEDLISMPPSNIEPVITPSVESEPVGPDRREVYQRLSDLWNELRVEVPKVTHDGLPAVYDKLDEFISLVGGLDRQDEAYEAGRQTIKQFENALKKRLHIGQEVERRARVREEKLTDEVMERMRADIKRVRGDKEKMILLKAELTGFGGDTLTEKLFSLYSAYKLARPDGIRRRQYLKKMNDVRDILGRGPMTAGVSSTAEAAPPTEGGQLIELDKARAARNKRKKQGA